MKKNDLQIYKAFLSMLKNKEKINIFSLSKKSNVDRSSIYYRLRLIS